MPCETDRLFHGYKPTIWTEWPSGGWPAPCGTLVNEVPDGEPSLADEPAPPSEPEPAEPPGDAAEPPAGDKVEAPAENVPPAGDEVEAPAGDEVEAPAGDDSEPPLMDGFEPSSGDEAAPPPTIPPPSSEPTAQTKMIERGEDSRPEIVVDEDTQIATDGFRPLSAARRPSLSRKPSKLYR
jgi:hypothetical protein